MDYLHNNREQFVEAINLAVFKTGLVPEIVEKDYYITLILRKLSEMFDFVVFKGGTSLSKCHKVIDRFSEDIDITIDNSLSQGQKKKLKYGIVEITEEFGMKISNIDDIRSRRDYNCYRIEYDSVLTFTSGAVNPMVIMETSFTEVSFPTVTLAVGSYIGELLQEEAPEMLTEYSLTPFEMKVQGLDRTLIDKVFAVCDYYLSGRVKKHSRHIYDIYKLSPLVRQDDDFRKLIQEVRDVRSKASICLSAQPDVNVTELLHKIIHDEVYKEDYNTLTVRLLKEKVDYNEAIQALRKIADSGFFD
jgi:Uncharacterized conserved protein